MTTTDCPCAYNKRLFNRLVGRYVQERRLQGHFSVDELASVLKIDHRKFKLIEAGQKSLQLDDFDKLSGPLQLSRTDLDHFSRIAFIRYLFELFEEIDAER